MSRSGVSIFPTSGFGCGLEKGGPRIFTRGSARKLGSVGSCRISAETVGCVAMTTIADLPSGWAFPPGSRKAHYFEDGQTESLCGRWGFQMVAGAREPDNGVVSKDDCVACRRKLEASA